MRLALVAMSVWWLMVRRIMVSTNCACTMGPATVTIGSPGKMGVPSGTAHTSHSNLKWDR